MQSRVRGAAIDKFHTTAIAAYFEHGQWWIENVNTGAQYSVVDAEGPGTIRGFDFEQVTEARED